jgi:hypothetical protein
MAEPDETPTGAPERPETDPGPEPAVPEPGTSPEPAQPGTGRSRANPQARSRPRAADGSAAGRITEAVTADSAVTGDALATTAAVGVEEAVLYAPGSGEPYRAVSPAERTRLRMRGYSTTRPYQPGEHTVEEAVAYMRAHPSEVRGILGREREGQGRKTILEADVSSQGSP